MNFLINYIVSLFVIYLITAAGLMDLEWFVNRESEDRFLYIALSLIYPIVVAIIKYLDNGTTATKRGTY